MDGEEGEAGKEGRVEKRTEGVFESKLNLNSALPYADLQRNAPYVQKLVE